MSAAPPDAGVPNVTGRTGPRPRSGGPVHEAATAQEIYDVTVDLRTKKPLPRIDELRVLPGGPKTVLRQDVTV